MVDQPIRELQPTFAYLMTDVAGSTRLWERDREAMARCVMQLDNISGEKVGRAGGRIIKSRGEGDSHFSVFGSVDGALTAAAEIMIALKNERGLRDIEIRAAIHAGSTESWAGDYYGPTINRCARIRQAANPGQILASEAVYGLASKPLPVSFKDLGVHRLRDLMQPERLFQVLHPDLPSEFNVPDTLSVLSHNLPIHLTSFVGRDQEIKRVAEIIRSNRLTTVSGAGGVGKTRLTLQVAAECVEEFKDGAWFIDLAQTDRNESVLPILSAVLGSSVEASESKLFESIGHREMLLILDNCEHLYEECRKIAGNLLLRCPNVRILATSRRLLEVRGEYVYKLNGLSVPERDSVDDAYRYDGFRLFVERAEQRGTGLVVSDSTIPSISQLCRQLDGLPLAIEMVSSLTDLLSVSEISRSIAEYLEMPVEHGSDDPRQKTMANAIDWSRKLVSSEARDLLPQLAFFPNTWTLDAVHEVCLPGLPVMRAHALVRELVNHSLVFAIRTLRDEVRFGLLQTTREVVAKTSAVDQGLLLRYVEFCRKEVEKARSFFENGEEPRAHELIDLEWETLAKALEQSYEAAPEACVAIALSLKTFWMRGTRIREGKRWYEKLADLDRVEPATKISVQLALSALCILLGENDQALAVLVSAEHAVQPIGGYDLAVVIGNLAVHRDRMERYQEAKEGFERCCLLFRQYGSPSEEALALLNFGVAKLRLNEPVAESAELYKQALECARRDGSISMQAKAHSSLAHVEKLAGRLQQGLSHNRLALQLWQDGPYLADCALELLGLAEIFLSLDCFDASAKALHIAERLEQLSQSPFPSRHQTRLDLLREAAKLKVPPEEWRAGQRLMKSKSSGELITMAIRLVDEVATAVPETEVAARIDIETR